MGEENKFNTSKIKKSWKTQEPQIQTSPEISSEPNKEQPQDQSSPGIKQPTIEVRTSTDNNFEPIFEQNAPPSLDKIVQYHLDQQKKTIDDEATLKKKNAESMLYQNLVYLVNLAASGKSLQSQLTEQHSVSVPVLVKDNSEAIRLINLEISDPTNKDVATLIKLKSKLQGVATEEQQPEEKKIIKPDNSTPINSTTKKATGISTKLGLALFALTIVVVIAVGYGVMGLLH
jgi:hypothetical protein